MKELIIKRLHKDAVLPTRATEESAGFDIYACIDKSLIIPARGKVTVPTGIAIAIGDKNAAAFIFARSGLGIKHGIIPSNAVGVIDSDYRGEIMVGLTNHTGTDYTVSPGDRIAQMILMPVYTPALKEVNNLSETDRGAGGFGSSGK